jgi:phage shock protein A
MQRALDKTENMKARAAAVGELEDSGTFEDLTQLGPGKDDLDRQLEAIGAGGAVDDELSKMKAELGSGGGTPAAAIEASTGATAPQEGDAPAATDSTAEDAGTGHEDSGDQSAGTP